MPLIDFPDVPDVAGVPMLKRVVGGALSATGLAPVVGILRSLGIFSAVFGPQWGIFTDDGVDPYIVPDSIIAVEVKADYEIANHPVEAGTFSSYNKVAKPREVNVTMVCSGQSTIGSLVTGAADRPSFLKTLDEMVADLDTYTIVTPDATYPSFNLVHFDYKRTSAQGVSSITANCRFQEVRQTATLEFTKTATADGQSSQSGGQVSAQSPSSSQSAAISQGGVQ